MASDNQQDDFLGLVLPDAGVVELTDCLTEYMTEIELDSLPDIIGQVLDDFIDQAGGMPEDLRDSDAFDVITVNQLAVTLAYQVGRLEGRSPQIVNRLIKEAVEKWAGIGGCGCDKRKQFLNKILPFKKSEPSIAPKKKT